MRILYFDIDTLRADHLGCYGYHRNTSPNMDRIAAQGTRFTNFYASDAPCLPSRAALFLGRPGIHTGIINHGGVASEPFNGGRERGFRDGRLSWPHAVRNCGHHAASFSSFGERHSAWWFYNGWHEMYNCGHGGAEIADDVIPNAVDWIERKSTVQDWFLHVHIWDPHTPYRTPEAYGNPFENDPPPDWPDADTIQRHFDGFGAHSAQDTAGLWKGTDSPRQPGNIPDRDAYRRFIDGYDVGIRYADDALGKILDALEAQGILEDTAIIISSDHGENMGELNIYGDHHTADNVTCRIPLLVRWPGKPGGVVDDGLHYNYDLPPTTMELLDGECGAEWDGQSFASALDGNDASRDSIVFSNCAWSCQRSVRFREWMLMRTYHSGAKDMKPIMLFDIDADPYLTNDLTEARPELVNEGLALLERWTTEMMATSEQTVDPLWTVMSEGGPFHTRDEWQPYVHRLREAGRSEAADWLEATKGGYRVGLDPTP